MEFQYDDNRPGLVEYFNILTFETGESVQERDFYVGTFWLLQYCNKSITNSSRKFHLIFKIPSEIFCEGRLISKQLPLLPKAYSLTTHLIEEDVRSDGELGLLLPFRVNKKSPRFHVY
jgi:hypothetical protein